MDRALRVARVAAALALMVVAGAQPVAAQVIDPEGCAAMKDQIRYLTNEGALIQEAGLKNGVDLLAEAIEVRNATCGTPGDDSVPPSADPVPPTPVPVATPAPVAPTPVPAANDNSAFPSPAACMLVTESEVGAAMKEPVTASADDPLGDPTPDVQGCDFNGAGTAFTTIIYFQAAAEFVYDGLRSTAEANGVQSVPGLGDRAFVYVGANGPGVVVAKGDKVFALEFNGIGNGSTEQSSLLVLAQQAVNRVSVT